VSRKPRSEEAGAVHHVFARGNNRRSIFCDDLDRRRYLSILGNVVSTKQWRCLAYCLMDNHVHLLVVTPIPNLGSGMQMLHGVYAQKHNQRHRTSGHVFQGRFGARRVKNDAQLWMTIAYIARNPVQAGLCEQPDAWPWNSHTAIVADTAQPWLAVDDLIASFTALGGDPYRRYIDAMNRDN
jgi:putative transposase